MTTMNIDRIFNPKSIAVIGASEKKGSVGASIMRNLVISGFKGEILPVNPGYSTVMGLPCFSGVDKIDHEIDTAVIATPISTVPDLVNMCGSAGMGGVTIISAGGKEIGEKGKKIEDDIINNAAKTGLRVIGPNCLGFMNTGNKLNASFAHTSPLPGKIAFLSQSGAVCTSILDLARKENVGFSHFVSLGSMADVDFADMLDFFSTVRQVESIVMYVENITNIRNFMSAARAVSRVKPIIALKAGRSEAGARAAASHTGALAGEDRVYDAAFKRAGILRVNDFEELFDCAEFLAKQKRPDGGRLAIVTNAGGPGVMAADALEACGMAPAPLCSDTIERLDEILPGNWSRANPIDVLGDSSHETYLKAARICSEAEEFDGLLVINSPTGVNNTESLARSFAEFLPKSACPVFTAWMGGQNIEKAKELFNKSGIVTYNSPERAVRTFVNLYQYGRNLELLQQIPVRKDKRLLIDRKKAKGILSPFCGDMETGLTEKESKDLLAAYGIPVNQTEIAMSAAEAVDIAEKTGFPVVLKICSRDILHKSDSGGVALNLCTAEEVKNKFNAIIKNTIATHSDADIIGVTVQKMHSMPDYELIMGAKKDKDFGPVIIFGLGGVLTEVFKDLSMALPPLNPFLAQRLLEDTKIFKVLKGYRNIKPVDISLIEEMLIRLGRLVADFPEIEALDINPVLVKDGTLSVVDARVIVKKTEVTAPMHMVVSSYPWQQEASAETTDNHPFFIRPIRPSDTQLIMDHFYSLSPRSVYLRFFSPMKQLSKAMLIKLTQIDYDREVALVAVMGKGDEEKIVGVSRIIFELNKEQGEFAVAVSDEWQGKGIGAALLRRCIKIVEEQGLKKVWGIILAENTQMKKLARKLGFNIKLVPGSSEYELHLDLTKLDKEIL